MTPFDIYGLSVIVVFLLLFAYIGFSEGRGDYDGSDLTFVQICLMAVFWPVALIYLVSHYLGQLSKNIPKRGYAKASSTDPK